MEGLHSTGSNNIQYACKVAAAAVVFTGLVGIVAYKLLNVSQLKTFLATSTFYNSSIAGYLIYKRFSVISQPTKPEEKRPEPAFIPPKVEQPVVLQPISQPSSKPAPIVNQPVVLQPTKPEEKRPEPMIPQPVSQPPSKPAPIVNQQSAPQPIKPTDTVAKTNKVFKVILFTTYSTNHYSKGKEIENQFTTSFTSTMETQGLSVNYVNYDDKKSIEEQIKQEKPDCYICLNVVAGASRPGIDSIEEKTADPVYKANPNIPFLGVFVKNSTQTWSSQFAHTEKNRKLLWFFENEVNDHTKIKNVADTVLKMKKN